MMPISILHLFPQRLGTLPSSTPNLVTGERGGESPLKDELPTVSKFFINQRAAVPPAAGWHPGSGWRSSLALLAVERTFLFLLSGW